jgi:hypothetical protein
MKIMRSRGFFHRAKPVITSAENEGVLLIFLGYGQIDEVVVPFSGIDLLALQTQRPSLRTCRQDVGRWFVPEDHNRQLGSRRFERAIVDFGQWQISDVWVDPFFEAALPQFQCCWCNWFALAALDVVEPPFCLFAGM